MSTETRTIRPFVGLGDLETCLTQVLLRFGTTPCTADSSITVDVLPTDYLRAPVVVEWGPDKTAFERFKSDLTRAATAAELDPASLELVVIARTNYLKITEALFSLNVSKIEALSRELSLAENERPRALSAPFSGCVVDAYLLLSRDITASPLRPHLRASWLARASFTIQTSLAPALLPPTPLTSDVRQQFGLLAKTVRYLHFGDHDVLQPYQQQEQPTYYVDENLLAQLNARRTAPSSKAIQVQLAVDFLAAVVRRAAASAEDLHGMGFEDLRGSLLGSVLRIAAGPGASDTDLQRLLDRVTTDPDFVIGRAEHWVDVSSAFAATLQDGD